MWADGKVSFSVRDGGAEQIIESSSWALASETWAHIRAVGDGTNYYLFVNGSLVSSAAITSHVPDQNPNSFYIGSKGGTTLYFDGHIDEVRVSNVARSIVDFQVPTSAYPEMTVRRYIEYMDPAIKVDSGLTYSGPCVSEVSGLDHLDGKTVDILADGVVYDRAVVTDGEVTINPAASQVVVGLPYTATFTTVKPNFNQASGTIAGLPKKWAELFVSFYLTSTVSVNGEIIDFRPAGLPLGAEIPLWTGEKRVSQLGWNDGKIVIEHSEPRPCTILGIFGTLEVGQ
jgi:hypothetical protein